MDGALPPVPPSPPPPSAEGGRSVWRGRWRRWGNAEGPAAGTPSASTGHIGGFPRIEDRIEWPWQGVEWSLAYVAFLAYVFITTSYVVNLGQATMVLAVVGMAFGEREKWRFPLPTLLMALFLLVVAVGFRASPFANRDWTPFEDMMKVYVIFIVAASVLTTRARIRFFMFFYLAVYALYPVRGGIFNWFVYRAATQGRVAWNHAFENPNDLAALLILPLGLCLAFLVNERAKLLRQASMAGLAAIPMIVFMTQSRGAILAIGAAVVVYLMIQGRGRTKAVISIGAIALVVVVFAPSDVWNRLNSLKTATEAGDLTEANDSRSAEQRFEIWKVAWKVHEEWPLIGVGWGSYPYAHAFYSRRQDFKRLAGGARDAHNTYLTVLGETGYLGFFVWASVLFATVAPAIRAVRRIKTYSEEYAMQLKAVLLALLAFGLAGLFGTFAHITFTYLHLALVIALTRIINTEVDEFEGRAFGRRAARA